jgi:hypothetical protein
MIAKNDEINQKINDIKEANDKDHTSIREELHLIRENHLKHIGDAINRIENKMIVIDTNQAWQLKFFWIVAGTFLTTLITAILAIIIETK